MRKLLPLYYLLAMALPALAQQPQLLQERSYFENGLGKQILSSAPDLYGNVLYSGPTVYGINRLKNTFLMVKPNTDTIWTKHDPTELNVAAQTLRRTNDGSFIFGGAAKHPTTNYASGAYFRKLTSQGQLLWNKPNFFNTNANINFAALCLPDKSYLVGGTINDNNYTISRVDSMGNFIWHKYYNRTQNYYVIRSMEFTPNGNAITAGNGFPIGGIGHIGMLLLNQNGDSLSGKQIIVTGPNHMEGMYDSFNRVLPLSDGGYLLTATTDTILNPPYRKSLGMVVRLDANMNVVWKYVHRNQNTDEYAFAKAKELTDGSILVLGFQYLPTQGGNGFQLYRFGLNGQLINVYPFTSSICSQTWGITLDYLAADSTYLVGGRCGNNPPITYGYYVAKVKVPGLPLPVAPFTVTSTKQEVIAFGAGLGQSYPNPTTSTAIIPYTLPQRYSKASILIREIATGREIRRYELRRGYTSLNVDLSQLSNGLYLYSLVVDEQPVATKKLAVMK